MILSNMIKTSLTLSLRKLSKVIIELIVTFQDLSIRLVSYPNTLLNHPLYARHSNILEQLVPYPIRNRL